MFGIFLDEWLKLLNEYQSNYILLISILINGLIMTVLSISRVSTRVLVRLVPHVDLC